MNTLDLLGWAGTLSYLVAHAYISVVNDWKKALYYSGNLFAAASLVLTSVVLESWQAVAINAFWGGVSILLLLRKDLSGVPFTARGYGLVVGLFLVATLFLSFYKGSFQFGLQGWASTFVFCAGYLLFCANKLSLKAYFAGNAYAAAGIMPQLWLDNNWPVFGLEACWVVISVYGFYRAFQRSAESCPV